MVPVNPASVGPKFGGRRGHTVVQAAFVGVATLVVLGVVGFYMGLFGVGDSNGFAQDKTPPGGAGDVISKLGHFQGWDKPDLAIVLTGEQHGYLQPCGCTSPQYGGLTRRYNFFQMLAARGWPVVAVDLGDVPAEKASPQILLKYRYAMVAMEKMNYGAAGIGALEMNLPLVDAMAETLNNPSPKILCANLSRKGDSQIFQGTVFDWELVKTKQQAKAPALGVIALAGKGLEAKVKVPGVVFEGKETPKILLDSLRAAKKSGADLIAILYQGGERDAIACAEWCLSERKKDPTLPRVDIIQCLGEQLPPASPLSIVGGETMVLTVGHKGQHLGVVGAFRTGNPNQPYQLRYHLVRVDPEFETPKGKEKDHPMMQLMEQYAKEVKDGNYLAQYKKTTHEIQTLLPKPMPEYAGSDSCQACHAHAYKVWKNSPHSHAFNTLEKSQHPSLRQYDGECLVCHTVGFKYKGGFVNEKETPDLKDVGCESCHGPASEHVRKPGNLEMRKAINKFKYLPNQHVRVLQIDNFCQSCHDLENDNKWELRTRWPVVEHMTPAQPGMQATPPLQFPKQ